MRVTIVVAALILALGLSAFPVSASQDYLISCEGTESTGGGANRYQYTLQNISGATLTLTDFFVGTGDSRTAYYTFVPTAGFTASIIPNDGNVCSVTYTTQVKTPHGVVPPVGGVPSAAVIYWTGSTVVAPMGTVTFAFDHPGSSNDHEWFANGSAGWTISQSDQPIAGPMGTYTIGYIHAPNPVSITPAISGWRVALLVVLIAAPATWLLLRRRQRASSAV
jgi:hypothetical protein